MKTAVTKVLRDESTKIILLPNNNDC